MKQKIIVPIIAAILTIIPVLLIFSPFIFNFGRTSANTKLLGRDYSFLKRDQIISRINSDFSPPSQLILVYQDAVFPLNLSEISLQIDTDTTASNLLLKNLNQGLGQYLSQLFRPQDSNLVIKFDDSVLSQKIASISAQIEKPFIPTEFQLVTNPNGTKSITVNKGQLGISVDDSQLTNMLISASSRHNYSPLEIPIVNLGSLPLDSDLSQLQSKAAGLIGKSLILQIDTDKSVTLDDKTLISWIDYPSGISPEKLSQYLDNLTQSYKRDPVNAVFQVENNKVLEFRPATKGLTIDTQALSSDLPEQINKLSEISEKSLTYTVPVQLTDPSVSTADANTLGIKELLGKGTSTFHHSTAIRNKNVEKGASVVNRILVAPGETFSFVKALGDVSLESGYYMAYIIRAGKTELDVGGGICQVSTTFFRAMLNAGLDIKERRNHAYRVSYYEEDMPPGYDATVFIPSPDLSFVNDTGNYLLIQNTYDGVNKSLTYEIWGTSDGRQAEISNYRQWGAAAAPPDVYIDDPTLPPGKVVQVEHRIPGLKTSFDWKVTRDGQVIHQKTFTSSYTPWAAFYRRGPQI